MNLKMKFNFSDFEPVSEDSGKKLIGGFSASMSFSETDPGDDGGAANNCSGGNCVEACGKGQNVNCNTVTGCGT